MTVAGRLEEPQSSPLKWRWLVLIIIGWQAIYWTYSDWLSRPFDDWKETLFYLGGGILGIFYLLKKRTDRIPRDLFFILFFLYLLLGLLNLQRPHYEGILELSRLILWAGCVGGLSLLSLDQRLWIGRLALIASIVVVILTTFNLFWRRFLPYESPFMFPAGHAIYYGDFIALHIPLALYFIGQSRWKLTQALLVLALLVLLSGVWLSGTRASIVSLGLALFIGGFFFWWFRMIPRKVVVTLFLFIFLSPFFFQWAGLKGAPGRVTLERLKNLQERLLVMDWDGASSGRWDTYVETARLIRQKWLRGWGPSSFRYVYPRVANSRPRQYQIGLVELEAHPGNEILYQAATVGLFGPIFFLLWWVGCYWYGLRRLHEIEGDNRLLLGIVLLALTFCLVSWQFSPNFHHPLIRLTVSLYISLFFSLIRPDQVTLNILENISDQVWRKVRWGSFVVFLVSFLIVGAYQASLYATVRKRWSFSFKQRAFWAKTALYLAPGAFGPLLDYSSYYLWGQEREKAWPITEKLFRQFPYLPIAIYQKAAMEIQKGKYDEAISLLEPLQKRLSPDEHAIVMLLEKARKRQAIYSD